MNEYYPGEFLWQNERYVDLEWKNLDLIDKHLKNQNQNYKKPKNLTLAFPFLSLPCLPFLKIHCC